MADVALGYTITIDVTSEHTVDGGDGTVWYDVIRQGGPWTDGDLTHTYVDPDIGNAVTITQHWTAGWTATAPDGTTETGHIADILETQSSFELPVIEVQAVGRTTG